MLAKWWWRFKNGKDELRRKIVWAIHHSDRSWTVIPAKVSIPGPWKHIVNINRELSALSFDLSKLIRKEVKNGENFWFDCWRGNKPFVERFPLLVDLEIRKGCLVSDRLLMHEGVICGRWGWHRQPVGANEVEELRDLLLVCQQVILEEGLDQSVWGSEGGCDFSVRSMKDGLDEIKSTAENYVMEWNNWAPKKIGIHAWRVEMGRIPVLLELVKRGISVTTTVCPVYEDDLESAEHLVVSCNFAQSLWSVISSWCKVPSIYAFSVKDLLELHRYTRFPEKKAKAFNVVCLTTIWCIWSARNTLVFEGKPVNLNNVVGEIKALSFLWVKNRRRNTRLTWEKWRAFNFEL
ncbi:uncharacterized protein LOC143564109 [Bidens hawaiensis]|uniref:uncharacterized protein LOC143564109 n=1 Tax=Bidens hawaiensis TaxID=980011 RepID=UPI00404AA95A